MHGPEASKGTIAATSNKRPLPAKVAAMKARKRLKLNHQNVQHEKSTHEVSGDANLPRRKVKVRADSLKWTAVGLPDHMEDAEGFYGLDEISDVDVSRDEVTGQVSFTAAPSNGAVSRAPESLESNTSYNDFNTSTVDELEFHGFEDEKRRDQAHSPIKVATKKESKAKADRKTASNGQKRPQEASTANTTKSDFGHFLDESNGKDVDVSAWRALNLSPDILSSLSRLGFSRPTPIQQSAIPEILSGHDVVGKASTGSGKTLAFGIPILETFLERRQVFAHVASENVPLALILSPTRELAHQLEKHLTALCSGNSFDGPSIATLTGGLSLQKQQRLLKHADIIIGTPGRLWEIISEGKGVIAAFKKIQFLVVDEADRLLSEGHFKEVEEILNALEREEKGEDEVEGTQSSKNNGPVNVKQQSPRQTLVFSATFDRSLQHKLASTKKSNDASALSNAEIVAHLKSKLNFLQPTSPKFIDSNPSASLPGHLAEFLLECPSTEKDLHAYTLLLLHPRQRTLIFTNSISAVRRLTPLLQHLSIPALALHSGMPQKSRLRSLERFTASSSSVLVATDVAARGLDIANVDVVLHYHLPRAADTYVHRSGRTARAGQSGKSILICGPEEVGGVRRLVAQVHARHATSSAGSSGKRSTYIRTLDLDRRIVSKLRPRAVLAKKIADTTLAKEKGRKEDDFLRQAAEELGVEYDSGDLDEGKGKKGRGAGRKKKEKEARGLSKSEVGGLKAELAGLLRQRVNVGVSERYLTNGGVDVEELLRRKEARMGREEEGDFLGDVSGLLS